MRLRRYKPATTAAATSEGDSAEAEDGISYGLDDEAEDGISYGLNDAEDGGEGEYEQDGLDDGEDDADEDAADSAEDDADSAEDDTTDYEDDADEEDDDSAEDEYDADDSAEDEYEDDEDTDDEYDDSAAEYDEDEDEYEYSDGEDTDGKNFAPPTALSALRNSLRNPRQRAQPATGTKADEQRVSFIDKRERIIGYVLGVAMCILAIASYFHFRHIVVTPVTLQNAVRREAPWVLAITLALGLMILLATLFKRRAALGFTLLLAGVANFNGDLFIGIIYVGTGLWLVFRALRRSPKARTAGAGTRATTARAGSRTSAATTTTTRAGSRTSPATTTRAGAGASRR